MCTRSKATSTSRFLQPTKSSMAKSGSLVLPRARVSVKARGVDLGRPTILPMGTPSLLEMGRATAPKTGESTTLETILSTAPQAERTTALQTGTSSDLQTGNARDGADGGEHEGEELIEADISMTMSASGLLDAEQGASLDNPMEDSSLIETEDDDAGRRWENETALSKGGGERLLESSVNLPPSVRWVDLLTSTNTTVRGVSRTPQVSSMTSGPATSLSELLSGSRIVTEVDIFGPTTFLPVPTPERANAGPSRRQRSLSKFTIGTTLGEASAETPKFPRRHGLKSQVDEESLTALDRGAS